MKKLQYNSPVILTFFLLSLGVLLLDWITGGWTTLHAFCVYRSSLADPLSCNACSSPAPPCWGPAALCSC